MTNPPLRRSKGREAALGSSETESACMLAKPATAEGTMAASAPPAITASAYPWRIRRMASPMAFEPDAQAVTAGIAGPRQSWRMAIIPAAMLPSSIGMKRGDTRRGPFSISLVCSASKVLMPPMPEPKMTARRSGSTVPSMPLSSTACCAAATANWA